MDDLQNHENRVVHWLNRDWGWGGHAGMDEFWRMAIYGDNLAYPFQAETIQFSSYDRLGGNEDYGEYYGTDEDGYRILCDVEGPGVLTHAWCTWMNLSPTIRWKIFVDDTLTPIIHTPIRELFGQYSPFVPPLADSVNYSRFSYLPIPFSERLRITFEPGQYLYYHISVLRFADTTSVESFTMPPSAAYQQKIDSMALRFANPEGTLLDTQDWQTVDGTATVAGGATEILFDLTETGIAHRLLLNPPEHTSASLDSLWLRVSVDGYPLPVINSPFSSVFGAALGWRPYTSAFTGFRGDSIYLNIDIPFRSSCVVEINNRTTTSKAVSGTILYNAVDESDLPPYRLHAWFNEQNPTIAWQPYRVCDLDGPGNFLGMIWQMRLSSGNCLEGDEYIYRDFETDPFWKGTGTEDYFNGAYYWLNEAGQRLPFSEAAHGLIYFYWQGSVAAYRWHLTDPIPFEQHLRFDLDAGPYGGLIGDYSSTAFAYQRIPRWRVLDASGDGASTPGELLRILGYGLPAGASITNCEMDGTPATPMSADWTVSADSIADITVATPVLATGLYSVTIELDGTQDTVYFEWPHSDRPVLEFARMRPDVENCVFIGDTLEILINGVPSGYTADLIADGIPIPWVSINPIADAIGVIHDYAILPSGMPYEDHDLIARVNGFPDVAAPTPLKLRSFLRSEFEQTNLLSWRGNQIRPMWAPLYTHPDTSFPWGRDVAVHLYASQAGDSAMYSFYFPDSAWCRFGYFFGLGGEEGIVDVSIDDSLDLAEFDCFRQGVGWRIERSDTVFGLTRFLTEGDHTLTFAIRGRNPASTDYDLWLDQFIIQLDTTLSGEPLDAVNSLALRREGDDIRLYWNPVQDATSYQVYRGSDASFFPSPERLIATVTEPGYTDTGCLLQPDLIRFYLVIAGGP